MQSPQRLTELSAVVANNAAEFSFQSQFGELSQSYLHAAHMKAHFQCFNAPCLAQTVASFGSA